MVITTSELIAIFSVLLAGIGILISGMDKKLKDAKDTSTETAKIIANIDDMRQDIDKIMEHIKRYDHIEAKVEQHNLRIAHMEKEQAKLWDNVKKSLSRTDHLEKRGILWKKR